MLIPEYRVDFDSIVSFYITSFLSAFSDNSKCDDALFDQLQSEYGLKSLEIFKHALYWEVEKSKPPRDCDDVERTPNTIKYMDKYWDLEIDDDNIIEYIENYPKEFTDSRDFLGENWMVIANLIFNANTKNLIQTIDTLVDIEHNNGNVLNRVISNHDKYMDFVTTKAHALDIRELLPYSNDSFLIRTALRTVKNNGMMTSEFEDGYTDFLQELYVNLQNYSDSKEDDLKNIHEKFETCQLQGVENTLSMIRENSYAFCGVIKACNTIMNVFNSTEIQSGKFENCYIKNSTIENGYFKNCVLSDCIITGSPTIVNGLITSTRIESPSNATLDDCIVSDIELYSDTVTIVNSSEINVKLSK